MNNYLMLNGKEIPLTDEQIKEIENSFGLGKVNLKDIAVGETFRVGKYEFIVLEQMNEKTAVILNNMLYENTKFGETNNYKDSYVDAICNEFAKEIGNIIGRDNLCDHEVDLTAGNGMKCYGVITRRMSLLTLERLQKYGYILAEHKIEKWWWLATATGTKNWGKENNFLCVAPSGNINSFNLYYNNICVRPFCIFNSNILVSK